VKRFWYEEGTIIYPLRPLSGRCGPAASVAIRSESSAKPNE
jgi:hypothetical protein